jgi:hypothetical protein
MSSEELKITVSRVLHGDDVVKPITVNGFCSKKVPSDGYIISFVGPGALPLYVRDEDIEGARQRREEAGRVVKVTAKSWAE